MLTTLAAILITTQSAPLQALKRVERTYRAAGDIEAEFTQTYVQIFPQNSQVQTLGYIATLLDDDLFKPSERSEDLRDFLVQKCTSQSQSQLLLFNSQRIDEPGLPICLDQSLLCAPVDVGEDARLYRDFLS